MSGVWGLKRGEEMGWHKKDLENIIALPEEKLADALPRMEKAALQLLLVVDSKRRLLGTITDGDIRRTLLRGDRLEVPLSNVMNLKPKTLKVDTHLNVIRELMLKNNLRHIPLVDEQGYLVDLVVWLDIFDRRWSSRPEPVVIMAGGKGTRLDPFTKILPKPMIPLGDKPIVEVIMDKFYNQGFSSFMLSLGYKSEIIKLYFTENTGRPYKVNFVQEEEPLGTAGALSLLRDKIDSTFIVTNCDIIIEADYGDILTFHNERKNDLTVVGSLKEFTIPYGVLRTENGDLDNIEEKPNFHFLVNTGVYILESSLLAHVPEKRHLDMTDLILFVKEKGFKVGVFPYHGKWFDIGQWEEYRQTLKAFELS